MLAEKQQGFTLVELMVAMLLGSIIILGAGQLFLTTLKTFNDVGQLSRKQEAVIFASQTMTAEIRTRLMGADKQSDMLYTLSCAMGKHADDECTCTIYDEESLQTPEPIISFPKPLPDTDKPLSNACATNAPLYEKVENNGEATPLYKITLPLEAGSNVVFHVAHRDDVVTAQGSDPTP